MKNLIKIVISSLLCLSLPASATQADVPVICGHETQGIQDDSTYSVLNYGLYWFGDESTHQEPISYCDKTQGRYFDATKKHTMVFVHGYSPYSVAPMPNRPYSTRFNFNPNDIAGPNVGDLVVPWLKGSNGGEPWNVGVFYWNQFADEQLTSAPPDGLIDATRAAEAKIWRTDAPGIGMRWRDDQGPMGTLHDATPEEISKDITHTFADQYIASLKDYATQNPNADMRLVGESLGAQIVIHGAKLIADEVNDPANNLPKNLIPKQVVVLDPMVTQDPNGDQTRLSTLVSDVTALKQQGVIFSGYRTSDLSQQTGIGILDNTKLLSMMAFSDRTPGNCIYPGTDMAAITHQHTFGIWWYLLSYTLNEVPVVGQPGVSAPFARMPDSALQQLMNSPNKFVDVDHKPSDADCSSVPDDISKEWSTWEMKTANKSDPR